MPVQFAQAGYSIINGAFAEDRATKAQKKLAQMQSPTYKPSQSILDYYQSALQKYNTNPTDTAAYKLQDQNIKQGTAQGISALRDRRLGGGINSLVNTQNNGLLKAAAQEEAKKQQELGTLGQAARMKAGEEGKAFNYNSIQPFERNYNLTAMKAAGANQVYNKSIENLFGAGNAIQAYYMNRDKTGNGNGWNKGIGTPDNPNDWYTKTFNQTGINNK